MGKPKSVVLIAQDLFFVVRISDTLRAMGHRVLTVQHASELPAALKAAQPHLVILDLQADGMDPQAVVSAVRQALPDRRVPVLAFGPHTDVKRRNLALQAGCQRVVPKSVIASELPQLVASLTGP